MIVYVPHKNTGQVPCRRFRVRCYVVLLAMSPRQVCSFASQKYTRSLEPADTSRL